MSSASYSTFGEEIQVTVKLSDLSLRSRVSLFSELYRQMLKAGKASTLGFQGDEELQRLFAIWRDSEKST